MWYLGPSAILNLACRSWDIWLRLPFSNFGNVTHNLRKLHYDCKVRSQPEFSPFVYALCYDVTTGLNAIFFIDPAHGGHTGDKLTLCNEDDWSLQMTGVFSIHASCSTQKVQLYVLQWSWLEETRSIQLNMTLKAWIWICICTGNTEGISH